MPTQKYLKIGGAACNYSDADPVNISFSTSSPAQADFVVQLSSLATFPVTGQSIEWYLKSRVKLFAGVINKVDIAEQWEVGDRDKLHIYGSGLDDRLFRRTTWNR